MPEICQDPHLGTRRWGNSHSRISLALKCRDCVVFSIDREDAVIMAPKSADTEAAANEAPTENQQPIIRKKCTKPMGKCHWQLFSGFLPRYALSNGVLRRGKSKPLASLPIR